MAWNESKTNTIWVLRFGKTSATAKLATAEENKDDQRVAGEILHIRILGCDENWPFEARRTENMSYQFFYSFQTNMKN